MTMSARDDTRLRELQRKAVSRLVDAHAARSDEPLLLAVRYKLDEPDDVYLIEVLDGFPGGDDDELLETDFAPSANLLLTGKLHLSLGSPGQLRTAIAKGEPRLEAVRQGTLVFERKGDAVAAELKTALGI